MWPFTSTDGHGLWLVLYVLTLCLHAVFVGYVLVGTAYALVQAIRRVEDPIAEQIRDRLPFMLGCGITAGVAPLLFLQLLYQRHFYSANLILGPRWGAVVPALIAGFYALYVAKSSIKWRRPALMVGTACFLFVAWSWTEMHQLMQAEPVWKEMYAAGDRLYGDTAILPRLVLWLGTMTSLFAIVASWTTRSRNLALIGLTGRIVAVAVLAYFASQSSLPTHGWTYLLAAALLVEVVGWVSMVRGSEVGLLVVTAGATGALVAGAVVREVPRLAILEPPRAAAAEASGLPLFLATFVFGLAAIAWIVKTIRSAR